MLCQSISEGLASLSNVHLWASVTTVYDEKMHRTLREESTYQPIAKDPTPSPERKMNAQLMRLKWSDRLSNDLYMQLKSSAGRVPLLYGLPKVHNRLSPSDPLCPL